MSDRSRSSKDSSSSSLQSSSNILKGTPKPKPPEYQKGTEIKYMPNTGSPPKPSHRKLLSRMLLNPKEGVTSDLATESGTGITILGGRERQQNWDNGPLPWPFSPPPVEPSGSSPGVTPVTPSDSPTADNHQPEVDMAHIWKTDAAQPYVVHVSPKVAPEPITLNPDAASSGHEGQRFTSTKAAILANPIRAAVLELPSYAYDSDPGDRVISPVHVTMQQGFDNANLLGGTGSDTPVMLVTLNFPSFTSLQYATSVVFTSAEEAGFPAPKAAGVRSRLDLAALFQDWRDYGWFLLFGVAIAISLVAAAWIVKVRRRLLGAGPSLNPTPPQQLDSEQQQQQQQVEGLATADTRYQFPWQQGEEEDVEEGFPRSRGSMLRKAVLVRAATKKCLAVESAQAGVGEVVCVVTPTAPQ